MFMTRSEYDRGVNTFSPEGRLFQVEYAIEAIKLGSTAIAIKTAHGIVMAVEKRITSPLMEPSSMDKIMEIDAHIGCAVSGLTADAQSMVEHGRVQAQNHYFTYNEPMPARALTQSLCALSANFGTDDEDSMSRPFGVALLVAGHDADEGYQLYHTDPSGTFVSYSAEGDRVRERGRADDPAGGVQEGHDHGGGGDTGALHAQGCDGGKGEHDQR